MADNTLVLTRITVGGGRSRFGSRFWSRFWHVLRESWAGLADGLAAYHRYASLSRLDARSLEALGLTREDVARAAMFPKRPMGL